MEKVLTFSDSDQFYHQLVEMESRREEYRLDTGVLEVKALPICDCSIMLGSQKTRSRTCSTRHSPRTSGFTNTSSQSSKNSI